MTVPIRACAVLVATTIVTVALPTPEFGVGPPIQSTSLRALHEQSGVAVRVAVSSVRAAAASTFDGEIAYRQGAAAWLTSTVWSDTATWPCRREPFGFGWTV